MPVLPGDVRSGAQAKDCQLENHKPEAWAGPCIFNSLVEKQPGGPWRVGWWGGVGD